MDTRTKKQKLQAMANQTSSPHEAEIAKKKLADILKAEAEMNAANPTIVGSGIHYSSGPAMFFYGTFGHTVTFTVSNIKWQFTSTSYKGAFGKTSTS